MSARAPSNHEAPNCLLCNEPTRLLYPSNIPSGNAICAQDLACTNQHLSVHDDIYLCRRCGLGRSVPPLSPAEIGELYRKVQDPEYLTSEEERRTTFGQALEKIERYCRKGRMLEIGAAVGLFIEEARRHDWNSVVGIEPSIWAVKEARRRGLTVHAGALSEFDPEGLRFDAVVMWDVLEHLVDPVEDLKHIASLLEPGGVLALTTINMGSVGARLLRSSWPWLMRMHLHYFTRRSLTKLVERTGFEVKNLSTQSKLLKLGYVLERARDFAGPLATAGLWAANRAHIADLPVRINFGDLLMLVATRN